MNSPLVIGVTGGSGSGKSYLLKKICDGFDEGDISILSMDNYYKPIEEQVQDSNGIENFDLPEAIDREKYFQDLTKLINGESLDLNKYQFNQNDIGPTKILVKSAQIIFVEGIFTFSYDELLPLYDLKIYIDTPMHLMVKRRILRDAKERGYDLEDVLYRFEHHVVPAYEQYILARKNLADLVVPNINSVQSAIGMIQGYLKTILAKNS